MAREILFQGKRKDNGEWISGDLRQWSETSMGICDRGLKHTFPVRPETVGMCSGVETGNGKLMFEGDIVRYDEGESLGVVRYGAWEQDSQYMMGFYIDWYWGGEIRCYRKDIRYWSMFRKLTIVGNIHDNPELLNGKES